MQKQNIIIITIIVIASGLFIFFSLNKDNGEDKNKDNQTTGQPATQTKKQKIASEEIAFAGEKGAELSIENREIALDVENMDDNLAYFYNTKLESGKTIYFFVVKDKNGIYRAAANACQVCHDSRLGFIQEGNFMKCRTCGNKYPLEKIATEKGGCNPGPINPNLEVKNGKIVIQEEELEKVADLF